MLDALGSLPWSTKLFYVMLLLAFLANAIMACRPKYKPHWRIEFAYTATVLGIFLVYICLRISMVLDQTDYQDAVRWLVPCLAIPFLAVPVLFHWEDKYYRKAVRAHIEKELERDTS